MTALKTRDQWPRMPVGSKSKRAAHLTLLAAVALGLVGCGTAPNQGTTARPVSQALYEGTSTTGCVPLTEHGAEFLTNDGWSDTDYYPIGTWYAYKGQQWDGYVVGGEVGPNISGLAIYSVKDLTESSILGNVATYNAQADQAAQIDAYADQWASNTHRGMHPVPATSTPQVLFDGLAACWGDGRTITLPVHMAAS